MNTKSGIFKFGKDASYSNPLYRFSKPTDLKVKSKYKFRGIKLFDYEKTPSYWTQSLEEGSGKVV